MSVAVYTQGRHGRDPVDPTRCRAWAVNRGAQCVNRPKGRLQGVLLCGVHLRLAEKTSLTIKPGKLFLERQDEPKRIGKDITHLLRRKR